MPRTPVRGVGQGLASLQALVPWCSSCNGLMGGRVRCTGEANYFRDYKRLGVIATLIGSRALAAYGDVDGSSAANNRPESRRCTAWLLRRTGASASVHGCGGTRRVRREGAGSVG